MLIELYARIPPAVLIFALAATWLYIASTRWRWPLLVDALVILAFARVPSLAILGLLGIQALVRHTPTLAREVAALLGLEELYGWSLRVALFLLPALETYAERRAAPRVDAPAVPPQPTEGARQPLLLNHALKALNDDPTAPHLGFVGPTGMGKTTFVAVVLHYRKGRVLVTTPKGEKFDPWYGARVVRPTIDLTNGTVGWDAIASAIRSVHFEMLRRNVEGDADAEPLTLVIDELTTTFAQRPELIEVVLDLWTMGRSAGIRVVSIATDISVRGWKIEGRRDATENLLFVRVTVGYTFAIGRLDANWKLTDPQPIDTSQVRELAKKISLANREWFPVSASASGRGGGGVASNPTIALPPTTPTADRTAPDSVYDDLIKTGLTRDQGAAELHRMGYGFDSNRWSDRRAALGLSRRRGRPTPV